MVALLVLLLILALFGGLGFAAHFLNDHKRTEGRWNVG
jgi:hypothetical protein